MKVVDGISRITSAAIRHDGHLVAAGYLDGLVEVWGGTEGDVVGHLEAHKDAVLGLAFTSNRPALVTCSLDGTIKCWDTRDFEQSTLAHRVQPESNAYRSDGAFAVRGGDILPDLEVLPRT